MLLYEIKIIKKCIIFSLLVAHACHVNVFWLVGVTVHSSSLCCWSNTPLFACHLRTLDWQSAELVLNLQSGSRSSQRVDKRLRASVTYVLSVKQTQGTTNCVWGGKTNWEHFFGGCVARVVVHVATCWPPVWPVSPLTSQQIGVTIALLTTIIGVISVNQTWAHEWDILPISLQVSGGGGVVCLITQCVQDTDWWQAIIFYNPRLSPQLICNKQNNGVVKVLTINVDV